MGQDKGENLEDEASKICYRVTLGDGMDALGEEDGQHTRHCLHQPPADSGQVLRAGDIPLAPHLPNGHELDPWASESKSP